MAHVSSTHFVLAKKFPCNLKYTMDLLLCWHMQLREEQEGERLPCAKWWAPHWPQLSQGLRLRD